MKSTPVFPILVTFVLVGGCMTAPRPANDVPAAPETAAEQLPQPDSGDQLPIPRVQTQPLYPFDLYKAGIEGHAVVGFIVDQEGNVRDPYVIEATHEAFGRMAVACVSHWRFEPGRRAGRPVNTRMSVPFTFELKSPPPKARDTP